MKSLYARYIFEIEGIESFETPDYFFNYAMVENEFHVYEIYIVPEKRSSKVSAELADRIENLAAEKGADLIAGFVHKAHYGWEKSLAFQKRGGMEIVRETDEKITLVKILQKANCVQAR
jgi:hypothetical protein